MKKTEAKLELWYWYASNGWKDIGGGIFHGIYPYVKANEKYMQDYDNNKESSYLKYWNVSNLYGWAMSQKLPVHKFEWIEDRSQFNEDLIKYYSEESDKGNVLKVDVQYPETPHDCHNDLPILSERKKIEKVEKLITNLQDKTEYFIHIRN